MKVHYFVLVAELLSKLEKNSVFERGVFLASFAFLLGLFVIAKCVLAGCFEQVDLGVEIVTFHQFVIDIH